MPKFLGPNADLIGKPNSRWELNTPALVLDRPAFLSNIAAMRRLAGNAGVALRPHVKGPKSLAVGRVLAAASGGLACATLFEAETMAAVGISDLLVTSPIVTPTGIQRLAELAKRLTVAAVVDQVESVEAFHRAIGDGLPRPRLLVDIDVGQHRTGATDEDAVVAIARAIREVGFEYAGVQAYWGHLQGVPGFADRSSAVETEAARLRAILVRLEQEGLPAPTITGAGTGTAAIDASLGIFTEIQPGSFPFLDAAYERVDFTGDGSSPFSVSLFVQARVVSANHRDRVTIDAGMKAIPTDGPPARPVDQALAGAIYQTAGDEFGFVIGPKGNQGLKVGDPLVLVTPHCDTTANLHGLLHVVEGDRLMEIWPIEARGQW